MATTTISLPDDQLARLQEYAVSSGRSLDEVVREAVDTYLAHLPATTFPHGAVSNGSVDRRQHAGARRSFSPESQAEIDAALARLRANVPADLTPEEIDAEIDAAWQEVRQERRSRLSPDD